MYLLYLDESGEPNGWTSQRHFVLGGVAIHEGQVHRLTEEVDDVQARFFPGVQVTIPFHATEIRNGRGVFREWLPARRMQLLESMFQCISGAAFPNLIAFATAINVTAAKTPDQVLHDTFQDVCQRFNTFLLRQFRQGFPTKGLLIIDRAHQDHYLRLIAQFRKWGTDYGYLDNIVDIPYFAGRHDTRMMQLADFCAYAVFDYYENGNRVNFDKISPRFDRRAPEHPADGLKHITREQCSCEACSWRRE